MLYAYWANENEAKHYFVFHLMTTIACQYFPEEYQQIPVFSNEPCHILQYELKSPYSEKRWKQILTMSDVHKLTYKLETDQSGQSDQMEETFLQHLLKEK